MSKTIILGTSNSLLKSGYFSFLDKECFDRLSIGDTSSLSAIYSLLNSELVGYNFAVIDFNINEQNYMLQDDYPLEWCVTSFCYVIKLLFQRKIIPVVLLLDHEYSNWLQSYQLAICKKLNLNCIEISEVTNNYPGLPYADSSHYIVDVQKIIADKISLHINSINYNDYLFNRLPLVFDEIEFYLYSKSDKYLHQLLNCNSVVCQTNLLSVNAKAITNLTNVTLNDDSYLTAIVYWSCENTPFVTFREIKSDYCIEKNLRLKFPKPGLYIRSIGYKSKQLSSSFSIDIANHKQSDTEFTHNSIELSTNSPELLLVDFIFSNNNIFDIGTKLIRFFDLYPIKCDYSIINYISNNSPIYELEYAEKNFRLSYLHYCLHFKTDYSKDYLLKFANNLDDSYYKYFLIGNFLCDNSEQILKYFYKTISLKSNFLHVYYVFACTLSNKGYYQLALDVIDMGLKLNNLWKAGQKRKDIILRLINESTPPQKKPKNL